MQRFFGIITLTNINIGGKIEFLMWEIVMTKVLLLALALSLTACMEDPPMGKVDKKIACQRQTVFMQKTLAEAEREAEKIAQKLGMDKDKVDYTSLVSISYEVTGKQGYEVKVDGNYVYVRIELEQDGCLRHKGGGNELIDK